MSQIRHENPNLSIGLALVPIVFLISLLACSVFLFGADSSYGANQIVLIFATVVTALVGMRAGVRFKETQEGIMEGVAIGVGPTMIVLSVGMLIGTWILSGTVPAMIYYGVELLDPEYFYPATALICALVAVSIGSSWTVAGTLGIGLIAIAGSFGMSPAITAGAIVSGAYFGDKLSPMSDTTNLAAAATGVDLFAHIRHMLWTTIPSFLIALGLFSLLGSGSAATPEEIAQLQNSLASQFNLGPHLLLPLALMLGLVYKRFPAYPAIIASAGVGALFALVFQPEATLRLAGDQDGLGTGWRMARGVWISLFDGYASNSGSEFLDELLSKGGMLSMMNTISIILVALGLGGALERTGILTFLLGVALRGVHSIGSLVATTVATCVATNILTADQFISIALPGRMFRDEFSRRGLSRLNLSRTVEDSATITSALVPWNTCGAYMAATLGVATFSYAPFAFFNLCCPMIAVVYGFMDFAQKREDPEAEEVPGVAVAERGRG